MMILTGLVSFLSPCMLPILPAYVSYFSGDGAGKSKTFLKVMCFVLGFTVVFSLLGLFAGSVGALLNRFHTMIDLVSGLVVILLGLEFLGVIKLPFLRDFHPSHHAKGHLSAVVFGVVFAVSHAPCMSAFLGTALVTASTFASVGKGVLLLLCYSLGLAIPFLLSALVIDRLTGTFDFVTRHFLSISRICGGLLILFGILMSSGLLHHLTH